MCDDDWKHEIREENQTFNAANFVIQFGYHFKVKLPGPRTSLNLTHDR